jgi:acetylornithine/succinyldiaminopimelate/putrescine aminotransferase
LSAPAYGSFGDGAQQQMGYAVNAIENSSFLMNTAKRPNLVMARGEGSVLWDSTGKRYLDFVQGWAVNSLGQPP